MAKNNYIKDITISLRHMGYLYASVASKQSDLYEKCSKQELLAIDVLGMIGPCRMGVIAEYLRVGQSAITALVDRLEEKGNVERVRSQEDRRVWLVELSESGKSLFKKMEANYEVLAEQLLSPLSEEEQHTFVDLLARVTGAISVQD